MKILAQHEKVDSKANAPKLMEKQKDTHLTLCSEFGEHLQEHIFLECVITGAGLENR
jgi:hypothetical protein